MNSNLFVLTLVCVVLVFSFSTLASDQLDQDLQLRVEQAAMPLPPSLREGARVVAVDDRGEKKLLRDGTNDMMCRADAPSEGFLVACYHKNLDDYWTLAVSNAGGSTPAESRDYLLNAVEKGKVAPVRGGILYLLRGTSAINAVPFSVIFIPNLTAADSGLANVPNHHQPWLMWEGTALSHVMIPGK